LKLLHRREEYFQDLFSTARVSLLSLSKDSGRYSQVLEGIIVQGALRLMESEITVHARPQDVAAVKQAALAAERACKDISGRDVHIEVEATLNKEW
jgi:V-type H+-transporting ATPase subunit E